MPRPKPCSSGHLKIREQTLGPMNPRVATSLNALAQLYRAVGQHFKAEPLYQRALRIWEEALGKNHPHVANALENYTHLLIDMKRRPEAASMIARAKVIRGRQTK